jgi:hypothetical protein
MAEFSKQYCEITDMGFDGDFDVYEEWSKLEPNHGVHYICEGFGFTMIARKENDDKVWVLFEDEFIDFDEMLLQAQSKA